MKYFFRNVKDTNKIIKFKQNIKYAKSVTDPVWDP